MRCASSQMIRSQSGDASNLAFSSSDRAAYLFDPYLAVTASQIEALPHQITAVYGEMLPVSRCGSCSPTIPAQVRRSWLDF